MLSLQEILFQLVIKKLSWEFLGVFWPKIFKIPEQHFRNIIKPLQPSLPNQKVLTSITGKKRTFFQLSALSTGFNNCWLKKVFYLTASPRICVSEGGRNGCLSPPEKVRYQFWQPAWLLPFGLKHFNSSSLMLHLLFSPFRNTSLTSTT